MGMAMDTTSKDLFAAVEPRADVLSGTLTDAIFAANLDEVVADVAPATYGDPATFFATTYPSAGLRNLLNEVLGRVGGARPDGAPVVRVETNLGGGKTHNLIALYHAARGSLDPSNAPEFMDPALLPPAPVSQIGVFVGTSSGATSFPAVDGVSAHTLWGYLALQLGGRGAYDRLRGDDEALTAPGAAAISELLGGRPSLVMIDEVARYLAVADGRSVGNSTLAQQTTAFLMALMEAIGAQPNAALVVTTTQATDAFGEQTSRVLDAIAQAQSLIARKEHVLRPSDEADLPKILARRLFARVEPDVAGDVATMYAKVAEDAHARGTDLPERMTGASFASDVARSYPFHPDLVTVLDKRLSTIPNFQRTRGALRLLARSVRTLWESHPEGTRLVHLHHVDLADADTAEDLSSRLDKATFEPVIRADIASQPGAELSHAEQVDARMGSVFAKRLATTAYLYSLTRDVAGAPGAVLVGAVLAPGDDPNVIMKALDNLEASAWYLHTDTRGYRFSVEPSLAKLIQEAESQITQGKAKQAATDILADCFRDSALKVRRTWADSKIPDRDDDAWLVVLHWDEFGSACGVTDPAEVPRQILDLWEKTPSGGVREYRNRLVFLAPSAASHAAMLRAVRQRLALKDLATSSELLRALPEEKRREVHDKAKVSELEARVAVCNHMNVLYVPGVGGLEPVELDVVTTASVRTNQTDAVLDRLGAMEKTLTAGDKPLDPGWIRTKLGTQLDAALPTIELARVFARRSDLKLVLDRAQLSALVAAGVRNGVWEYHDTERGEDGWATRDHPGPAVRLADDTLLHPVGSAPPPAPVGASKRILDALAQSGASRPSPASPGSEFKASGKADVALVSARQSATDAKRNELRRLTIEVDDTGRATGAQLAKLLSVVAPTSPGASIRYVLNAVADLGSPPDHLRVEFDGTPSQFQPLKSALDNVLRSNDAMLKASVVVDFEPAPALSGQAVEDLVARARDTGPDKCEVGLVTEAGP